jgi:hypothetical protein
MKIFAFFNFMSPIFCFPYEHIALNHLQNMSLAGHCALLCFAAYCGVAYAEQLKNAVNVV